ncbi:guanylate-binding protein [Scenedesmus sp. NREL 46B-D3]|nr:guanylate-binding protein [Scenedesmus sp. NREL 46B-D3]
MAGLFKPKAQKETETVVISQRHAPPGTVAAAEATGDIPPSPQTEGATSTATVPANISPRQSLQEVSEPLPALQLVRQLPDGCSYELCGPAVERLVGMGNTPVAVVSIAGVARQGKSYILNRLVQAAGGGFPVSAKTDPCTHGIWMWPQAVPVQGKQHRLVFLDSEGIASKEQTNQASATMVALAGVVSSLLICNQVSSINENCLDNLFQAATILDHLFGQTGGRRPGDKSAAPACLPPDLLLLLRDFNLETELSPDAYLEHTLADLDLAGSDVKGIGEKNKMRGVIRDVFPSRSCMWLPHPGCNTKLMSTLPIDRMDPEFVEGVADLASHVYSRASPKFFKGVTLTGPLLVQLLCAAVEAANKPDGVLTLGSMWGTMVDAELKKAAEEAHNAYNEAAGELGELADAEEAERVHEVRSNF